MSVNFIGVISGLGFAEPIIQGVSCTGAIVPNSQNVRFSGIVKEDEEFAHPRGAALIKVMHSNIQGADWRVTEWDNWNDIGWSFDCLREDERLVVSLSAIDEDEWMIQVAPAYIPGFIGKLSGKKMSASSDTICDLAAKLDEFLVANKFSIIGWCWDGFPDLDRSTKAPQRVDDS